MAAYTNQCTQYDIVLIIIGLTMIIILGQNECYEHGEIRLVLNSSVPISEGRVEVCENYSEDGTSYLVCALLGDDVWGVNNAKVVCAQLDYRSDDK